MSTQTLYEVLTLKGGHWIVDSTYSNLDGAIEVARGLHGEKHYDGVKVIKDNFDSTTGDANETIVYDSNKIVRPSATAQAPSYEDKEEKKVAGGRLTKTAAPADGKSGNSDLTFAVKALILLAIILGGGMGILFGVDYLTALLNSAF